MVANDLVTIVIVAAGLIFFTYMIWFSRSRNRKVREGRERIKKKWRQRIEDE